MLNETYWVFKRKCLELKSLIPQLLNYQQNNKYITCFVSFFFFFHNLLEVKIIVVSQQQQQQQQQQKEKKKEKENYS